MTVYFGVLIFILFLNSTRIVKISDDWKLILNVVAIFLMMALRVDWGGDYYNYEMSFNMIHDLSFSEIVSTDIHGEIGYRFMLKILPTYRSVLIFFSGIFCFALYVYFKECVPLCYRSLAFVILFIDQFMLLGNISGIRNSIAVSAFIIGAYLLTKGQKIAYILLLLLASLFHTSAILFIPLVFLRPRKSKIKVQYVFIFFVIYALVSMIAPYLFNNLLLFTFRFDTFSNYEFYMDEELPTGARGISLLLIFYLLYHTFRSLSNNGYLKQEYLYLKFSSLWYFIALMPALGMISRLYFFTDFFFVSGLLIVLKNARTTYLRYGIIACLLLYYMLQFNQFFHSEHFLQNWLVYKSIL